MAANQQYRIDIAAADHFSGAFDRLKAQFAGAERSAAGLRGALASLPGALGGGAFGNMVSQVQALAGGFGKLTAALTAVSVAAGVGLALGAMVKQAVDLGSALDDLAEETGTSVEQLSRLKQVADVAGSDIDEIGGALQKLVKSMQQADDTSKGAGEAFAKLGIKVRDSQGNLRDSGVVMEEVAKALANYADGANKVALVQELMGKSGPKQLSYLKDLAEAGSVQARITSQQAAEAEKLEKRFNTLTAEIKNVGIQIGLSLIDPINKAIDRWKTLLAIFQQEGFREMMRAARDLTGGQMVTGRITTINEPETPPAPALDNAARAASEKSSLEAKLRLLEEIARFQEQATKEVEDRLKATEALAKAEADAEKKLRAMEEQRAEQLQTIDDQNELLVARVLLVGEESDAIERQMLIREYDQKIMKAAERGEDGIVRALERQLALKLYLHDAEKSLAADAKFRQELEEFNARAAEEQKRNAERMNETITDALMRAFESGKDFAQSFRDTVVNMFKTMVLRPIIQASVGLVFGGLSGAAGASGGGLGVGNLLSAGSSLFGGGSLFGTAGIGGLFSGSGGIFGSGAIGNSFALSSLGQTLGLSAIGDTAGGLALTGLGTSLGAAIPIAGIVLAGLAMSGAFGSRGGPKTGGFAQTPGMGLAPFFTETQSNRDLQTLVGGTSASYSNLVRALGGRAGQFDFGIGFDTDPQGTAANRISAGASLNGVSVMRARIAEEIGRDQGRLEEEIAKAVAEALKGALLASDIPEAVKALIGEFEGTAAEIETYVGKLAAANAVLTSTNAALQGLFGDLRLSDVLALGDAFGSLDAALQATGAYVETFYSAAERQALAVESLGNVFEALGVAVPASRDEFRALVEGLDLTTDAGRSLYQGLMAVAPAFAAVADAAEAALAKLQDQAMEFASIRDQVSGGSANRGAALSNVLAAQVDQFVAGNPLFQSMYESQGRFGVANYLTQQLSGSDFAGASEQDRDRILAIQRTRLEIARLDEALTTTATSIGNVADSVGESAAELDNSAELAEAAARLRIRILELEGRTVEALAATRELELAAADSSLHALMRRIYVLEDEATALEAANAAAAEAAQLARARSGLEAQILRLQGDAAGALAIERRLELEAMDVSLRPLQQRIYALQDEAAAAQEAQAAADALAEAWATRIADAQRLVADAADDLRDAYERQASGLRDTITRFGALEKSLRDFRAGLEGELLAPRDVYQRAMSRLYSAPLEGIAEAGRNFLEASARNSATAVDYRRDVARVMGVAEAGADVAGEQVEMAQQQLDVMTAQLEELGLLNENVMTFTDALERYLGIKDLPQKLIEAQQAESQAQADLEAQRLRNTAEYFLDLSTQWADSAASAFFRDQYDALVRTNPGVFGIPAMAAGGLASGWALVGERGPELVNFRAQGRVYSAEHTRAMLGNDEVSQLLRTLIAETRAANTAIAVNTSKTARVLSKFDYDGMPSTRTT